MGLHWVGIRPNNSTSPLHHLTPMSASFAKTILDAYGRSAVVMAGRDGGFVDGRAILLDGTLRPLELVRGNGISGQLVLVGRAGVPSIEPPGSASPLPGFHR